MNFLGVQRLSMGWQRALWLLLAAAEAFAPRTNVAQTPRTSVHLRAARLPDRVSVFGRLAERECVAADGSTLRDLDGRIVECAWDKVARFAFDDDSERKHESGAHSSGAWRYMRVRSDKDAPNFVTVYKHTLRSILDDITEDEIVAFVEETLKRRVAETADAGMGYAPPT